MHVSGRCIEHKNWTGAYHITAYADESRKPMEFRATKKTPLELRAEDENNFSGRRKKCGSMQHKTRRHSIRMMNRSHQCRLRPIASRQQMLGGPQEHHSTKKYCSESSSTEREEIQYDQGDHLHDDQWSGPPGSRTTSGNARRPPDTASPKKNTMSAATSPKTRVEVRVGGYRNQVVVRT